MQPPKHTFKNKDIENTRLKPRLKRHSNAPPTHIWLVQIRQALHIINAQHFKNIGHAHTEFGIGQATKGKGRRVARGIGGQAQ